MKQGKVYACYNKDKDIRQISSSGAVFSALAEYIFEHHGVVYGVAMSDDCYSAEFIAVTDKVGLTKLRGSKYLQAKIGNVFKKIRDDLQSGKMVLFTGTGCQVNGLNNFLGRDYENLISVDVICHGAPSPALWRKYARYQEQMNGGKLKSVNFRCKDAGWSDFGMEEVLDDRLGKSLKKLYISKDNDSYMQMFLRDYSLRPSCYKCVAKKKKKSDVTIADFWGINEVAPEMNDGIGTSLVLIRTDKGQSVFDCISDKMKFKEVSYEAAVKGNPAEYKSCIRPRERESFFVDMRALSFKELEVKYVVPIKYSLKTRVKRKMKNIIKSIISANDNLSGGGIRQITDYSLCFVFDFKENLI